MKITRVKIINFRSIDSAEIFLRDYTSLIGPNNAGKSTVLRAIDLILNQVNPLSDEWRVGHDTEPIIIEADFESIQQWERDKPGISSLVYDNRIKLRMTITPASATEDKKEIEKLIESFKPRETINGWPDDCKWSELSQEIKDLAPELTITGTNFKTKANQERLRTLIRERIPGIVTIGAAEWTAEGISIPAALQQALPQAQLIPAIRDAEEDSSPGAKTSFGILLKSIVLPALMASTEYTALMQAVSNLEDRLRTGSTNQIPEIQKLADDISDRISSLIQAKISLGLEPPNAQKFLGDNATLKIDDGTPTRIPLQGHGIQRALVFAMLEVLASQKAIRRTDGGGIENRTVVILFEEPELFIHPHLMRRLRNVLRNISIRSDWQVIITTHSPFLVDVATDPRALVIHRRSSSISPPEICQLKQDIFAQPDRNEERDRLRAVLDFHPTVCEAFFAKRALLVEGDTEVAILSSSEKLCSLVGINASLAQDTTVVSCDGKWTIIPILRILVELGVPVRVIHDIDRKGRTDAELAAHPASEFHANNRISSMAPPNSVFQVDDTFESILWDATDMPTSSKDKPFRAWKKLQEITNDRTNLDHAPRLREIVRFAFS